jgi:hypothetical protein
MIPLDKLRQVKTIIVHRDCPDGIASAMILHDALPDAEIRAVQYGPERDALEPEPGMLFCDMTPPDDFADEFRIQGALVLDHHAKQRWIVEMFADEDQGVFADEDEEPGVSGAVLAYREVWEPSGIWEGAHRMRDRVKSFAELAGIRDTWQREHPRWREACAQAEVLMFWGLEEMDDEAGPFLDKSDMAMGHKLLHKKLTRTREIAEHGCLRVSNVLLFNDPDHLISDVAEAARELHPDIEIVAGFFYAVHNDEMSLAFSLRSGTGGLDVGAIAKANGGGGHTRAAGFRAWACGRGPIERLQIALAIAAGPACDHGPQEP